MLLKFSVLTEPVANQIEAVLYSPEMQEIVAWKEASKKHTFSADAQGEWLLCFNHNGNIPAQIRVSIDAGKLARDYDAIAEKDHLKPIEVELKRVEDMIEMILSELEFLDGRENQMKKINGEFLDEDFLISSSYDQ
jgi:hypothetical protein